MDEQDLIKVTSCYSFCFVFFKNPPHIHFDSTCHQHQTAEGELNRRQLHDSVKTHDLINVYDRAP